MPTKDSKNSIAIVAVRYGLTGAIVRLYTRQGALLNNATSRRERKAFQFLCRKNQWLNAVDYKQGELNRYYHGEVRHGFQTLLINFKLRPDLLPSTALTDLIS